jgi:putative transcriptional regulator
VEIKNIKIHFLFLIIIFFYNTNSSSTDLPSHYTFLKNYKEGVYTQSFKDNLLVAQKENTDSKFYKSVIILLEHDEKGAIGFAVNKLLGEYPLSSLVNNNDKIKDTDKKKLDKLTLPIFWGGPLDENRIFVLHTNEYVNKSTKIFDSLSVTNDLKILIDISENNGPKDSLILIGISAWSGNQLEGEFERNQWSLADLDLNLIFKDENDKKWKTALKKIFVPL